MEQILRDTPQYAKKRTKKIRFTVGIKMVPTVKNERKNMKNVKALAVIDSETLMNSEFRERKFCVETLLPQGLCMLAGAPKIGKSWMALDLALHVAKGEALWGLKVHPGTVSLSLPGRRQRAHPRPPECHHRRGRGKSLSVL